MAENPAAEGAKPGETLRKAREARGMSVHQVAVELHVSDAVIQALESGDYAILGEPVFVRGHLRNYARTLGIPESEVLAAYDGTQQRPATPPLVASVPHTAGMGMSPRAREWSTRFATVGVVLVLLVLAVSWWLRRAETPAAAPALSGVPPMSTAVPPASTQPMAALTDLADNTSATAAAPKPAAKPGNAAAQAGGVPHSTAAAPATHPARATAKPVTRPPVSPAPVAAVTPAVNDRDLTHVKFTLGAASWVEVYDNNGKRLYYDLAPAGGSLDLSGAGPLQVFLGNAPGVSVELEGSAFDIKQYTRPDNTARFKLGSAPKPGA